MKSLKINVYGLLLIIHLSIVTGLAVKDSGKIIECSTIPTSSFFWLQILFIFSLPTILGYLTKISFENK